MMRWLVGTALAAWTLDAGSKWLSVRLLTATPVTLGALVRFSLVRNTGMALGLLSDDQAAVMLLPMFVVVCGWLVLRRYRSTRFKAMACGLVLGGFLGNFVQRLWQGYVLDMLFFPWLPWFVCNVADICICFGVAMLTISLLFRPADWEEKNNADPS